MIANTLIIVVSTALFVYWFRYTCRLILSTRTSKDFSVSFAQANQLSFPQVQECLATEGASVQLDQIHESLHRDYRLLIYLFTHAGEARSNDQSVERRMLMVDFCIMRLWYPLARRLSATQARRTLQEMAEIVSYFANSIGEQLNASAA